MSEIGQYEGNPGQEQIPDQPQVPTRVAVSNAGKNKTDTHGTGNVEQHKDREAVPVTNEIIAIISEHDLLEKIDQINIARRMTKIGEDCRGFRAVLCSMVDEMCHYLP